MFFEADQPRKSLISLSAHMWLDIFWSANFGFSDIIAAWQEGRSCSPLVLSWF
jgi:hypothetical protein